MSKITTFLTFAKGAEEAVNHYVSLFDGSKIGAKTYYSVDVMDMKKGAVMTIEFWLEGQRYVALNGGDHFKFSDAFSLQVSVDSQEEVDRLTNQLIEGGGEEGPCGWLTDRWGMSWQITPKILLELINDKDPARAKKAVDAMMKMKRINIGELKRAVGL